MIFNESMHGLPNFVLARDHACVYVIDIRSKIGVVLLHLTFTPRPLQSSRWCESLTILNDKSKSKLRYLVTGLEGEMAQVYYHSVKMSQIQDMF